MPADDNLKRAFDRFGSVPEPTDHQRSTARQALRATMQAHQKAPVPWWRRSSLSWSAAGLVAAALVAFVLVISTSTAPVDANLADVAAAARTVEAVDLPTGSYIYFRVDSTTFNTNETQSGDAVSYLLPTTEHLWVSGVSELRQRTVDAPIFESKDDEMAFYESGLADAEGVGQTTSESSAGVLDERAVDGLPTDPAKLEDHIVTLRNLDPGSSESEIQIVQEIAQLMSPRLNASSELRAGLLELLGSLDVSSERTADGGVTVLQRYEDDFGIFDQLLEFDEAGFLIRDTLTLVMAFEPEVLRPGVLQDIRYSRPTVVGELGTFPAR